MPPRGSPPATSCASGPIGPAAPKRRAAIGDARDLPIVYEDDALIVLEQAGRACWPCRCRCSGATMRRRCSTNLKAYLRRAAGAGRSSSTASIAIPQAWCCSRRATPAQDALKEQFLRHEPERVYRAVVYGHPSPPEGTWRDHLVWDLKALIQKETHPRDPRGKEAISHYRVRRTARRRVADRGAPGHRASAIRSASRRGCAATRWSASSATPTGRTRCERLRFRARRCTLTGWRSGIRSTTGELRFEAPLPSRPRRADRAPADALPDNVIRMRRFATRDAAPRRLFAVRSCWHSALRKGMRIEEGNATLSSPIRSRGYCSRFRLRRSPDRR